MCMSLCMIVRSSRVLRVLVPLPGCLGGWQEEEGGPWEGACPARWEAPAAISNLRSETGVAGVVRQPTPRPRPSHHSDQSPPPPPPTSDTPSATSSPS